MIIFLHDVHAILDATATVVVLGPIKDCHQPAAALLNRSGNVSLGHRMHLHDKLVSTPTILVRHMVWYVEDSAPPVSEHIAEQTDESEGGRRRIMLKRHQAVHEAHAARGQLPAYAAIHTSSSTASVATISLTACRSVGSCCRPFQVW